VTVEDTMVASGPEFEFDLFLFFAVTLGRFENFTGGLISMKSNFKQNFDDDDVLFIFVLFCFFALVRFLCFLFVSFVNSVIFLREILFFVFNLC
jgi:hypothetical protein